MSIALNSRLLFSFRWCHLNSSSSSLIVHSFWWSNRGFCVHFFPFGFCANKYKKLTFFCSWTCRVVDLMFLFHISADCGAIENNKMNRIAFYLMRLFRFRWCEIFSLPMSFFLFTNDAFVVAFFLIHSPSLFNEWEVKKTKIAYGRIGWNSMDSIEA